MAKAPDLLITTTHGIEGRRIMEYRGLVGGDAILGANMFRDFFAGIRDILGGRSGSYEKVLRKAKNEAIGDIRMALDQGQPMGDSRFIDRIEQATGQRREPKPRGWPRKVAADPAGEDAQIPLEM